MPKYFFKFISGKYQGGDFPIPDHGEIVVGRAADLDMVLVEDMVSRKHATITSNKGVLTLTDLGSTNGTFVNGEKIQNAQLKIDDRVLIGTSILKVVQRLTTTGVDIEAAKVDLAEVGQRSDARGSSTMSGDLEEVPLTDLLQLFGANKKTGMLTLSGERKARIFLQEGLILKVEVHGSPHMPAIKGICRLLQVLKGTFQFEANRLASDDTGAWKASVESTLVEATRQNDEAGRLLPRWPNPQGRLTLVQPLQPRLANLPPEDLDTLQQAINAKHLQGLLDGADRPDAEILTALRRLVDGRYLAMEDSPPPRPRPSA